MTLAIDQYFLGYGDEETKRLNAQHPLCVKTCGYLVHPSIIIPKSPENPLKVADCGTGTGIWLLDVLKTLPNPQSHTFSGFDMSSQHFPPSEQMPQNVKFHIQNMLHPFSLEEQGTYDLVSVRLMVLALDGPQWDRALQNVLTLLKPGGHIQWLDMVPTVGQPFLSKPGQSYAALVDASINPLVSYGAAVGRKFDGQKRLGEMFVKEGLEGVLVEKYASDRVEEVRVPFTRNALLAMRGLCDKLAALEDSGWTTERVKKVFADADKEIDGGSYLQWPLLCIIGRKPPRVS